MLQVDAFHMNGAGRLCQCPTGTKPKFQIKHKHYALLYTAGYAVQPAISRYGHCNFK